MLETIVPNWELCGYAKEWGRSLWTELIWNDFQKILLHFFKVQKFVYIYKCNFSFFPFFVIQGEKNPSWKSFHWLDVDNIKNWKLAFYNPPNRDWNRQKWSEVKSLSHVQLFATPWTVAHQAPASMVFSRQEYWNGLPFPFPSDLPDPGIESRSPTFQADALTSEPPGKPKTGRTRC